MKTLMFIASFLSLFFSSDGDIAREELQFLAEGSALTALKRSFDHPLLNSQWVGVQCIFNKSRWIGIQCLNNHVTSITLEGIGISRSIDDPLALSALTELTHLSFKNNSISGEMLDLSANEHITFIDLSINNFTGPISTSLLSLPRLQSLDLHDNGLNGSIPPFNQTSLKALNFSYNILTGMIPNTTVLQSFNFSTFIGNSLCGNPTPFPCEVVISKKEQQNNSKNSILTKTPYMTIFVVLDVLVLMVLSWTIFTFYKKKKAYSVKNKPNAEVEKEMNTNPEVVREEQRKTITFFQGGDRFDLDELLKASAEGLGKGNFGSCYKVKIDDARAIVVKRLRDLSPLTSEEFAKHLEVFGGLKHPNLMALMGYYYASDDKLFFYKFVDQGNLYSRIHGGRGGERTPFLWSARLAIAKGIGRAMQYLHLNYKGPPTSVPHGNLKSSNVLLRYDNDDEVALVCDYGLLPLVPAPLATQRMVAFRSPEYHDNRTISPKSDVWSYGCILLELVTGRVSEHTSRGGADLCNWVHRAVREEWTCEVFDGEILGDRGVMREMFKLLQVALSCCERFPERRPEMAEAVREVEAIKGSEMEDEEDYSLESMTPIRSN